MVLALQESIALWKLPQKRSGPSKAVITLEARIIHSIASHCMKIG